MKKRNGILKSILAAAATITLLPSMLLGANALDDENDFPTSGSCGASAQWSFSDGVLTISGKGKTTNYNYENFSPWSVYYDEINSVVVKDGITGIGDMFLDYFSDIDSVYIPDSVKSISESAFVGTLVGDFVVDEDNKYYRSDETGNLFNESRTEFLHSGANPGNKVYTVPDTVKTIAKRAFFYNNYIREVTLGKGVKTIEEDAFFSCSNLEKINLNESLEVIGDYAFYSSGIKKLHIPKNVKSIGEWAISYCENLKEITVDKDNKFYSSDKHGVLFNKDKTTLLRYPANNLNFSYTIPDSVTFIDDLAFNESHNLRKVVFGKNVKKVGYGAFSTTSNLRTVKFNESLEIIDDCAFEFSGITSLKLPESVKTIGEYAFFYCKKLTTVYISSGVNSILHYTFSSCDSLREFNVSPENKKYSSKDGVLFNKDKTVLLKYPVNSLRLCYYIPDSVKTVSCNAFCNCNNLRKLVFGENVETIEEFAIDFCENLKEIVLNDGLRTIEDFAIADCYNLVDCDIPDSVTTYSGDSVETYAQWFLPGFSFLF